MSQKGSQKWRHYRNSGMLSVDYTYKVTHLFPEKLQNYFDDIKLKEINENVIYVSFDDINISEVCNPKCPIL
ncbi:MAG: hypothetical protein LEGION0398_MBIBDBAK_00924 [Legionellaceae bacterium]